MTEKKGKFIVCRASAGSGKTFTLVKEYLKLALDGKTNYELSNKFTRILAITFTNKAANEMKTRVLSDLCEIKDTNNDVGKMADLLMSELGIDLTELRRRCEIVHSAILHRYSEFAVSTIDSFMHQIVLTFAHDLKLPVNFDLQLDSSVIIQESVDILLEKIGLQDASAITNVTCSFSESNMENGKRHDIQQELEKIAEELFHEDMMSRLERLKVIQIEDFLIIKRKLDSEIETKSEGMIALAHEMMSAIHDEGLTSESFHQKKKGVYGYLQKYSEGGKGNYSSFVDAFVEGRSTSNKSSTPKEQEAIERLYPDIVSSVQKIRSLATSVNTLEAARKNLYSIALLNEMNKIIQDYYTANGLVHISEFNKRINEVVRNEPVPFIYERIGNHYHHYLIDEFQDNSKLQWQNLIPLLENGLASNQTSFVVGDGKQAIYRWRQGDVEQFVRLPEVEGEHDTTLRDHYSRLDLDTNYRTGGNIIQFNNSFFEWIANSQIFSDNQELKELYLGAEYADNGRAAVHQNHYHDGGHLQISFWDNKSSESIFGSIVDQIRIQHDEKGYKYKDITIIARNNKSLSAISQLLIQNDIPAASSESFRLSNSIAVDIIETVLKLILQPNDNIHTALLLKRLETLHQKDYSATIENIYKYTSEPKPRQEGANPITRLLSDIGITLDVSKLEQLSLYDCCEEIVRMFNLNEIETAYVSSFLNTVNNYCIRHNSNIAKFLKWFEKQKSKSYAKISQEIDAVKLLTIHKSKGLESPIIIYPILTERSHGNNIWIDFEPDALYPDANLSTGLFSMSSLQDTAFEHFHSIEKKKQTIDSINLLYVAMTRPKDKMFVYCESPTKDPGKAATDSYYSLLKTFCKTWDKMAQTTELPDSTPELHEQFVFGEDMNNSESQTQNDYHNIDMGNILFQSWQDRLQIARQNNVKPNENIRRGIIIHDILSRIDNADTVTHTIDKYCELHDIEDLDKKQIADSIQKVVTQPHTADFFSKEHPSKCEASIFHKGKELRPDRIVYKPNEILVVDFKTGYADPHSTKMEQYQKQVEEYCNAIAAIHKKPVKGYLLFVGQELPVEVCNMP